MSKNFYVYMLLNPLKKNLPFYIGKGKGNRYEKHFKEKNISNQYKHNTIQKIIKETGCNPPIEIYINDISEQEAFYWEEELIAFYGRKDKHPYGILTNLTDGGEGVSGYIVSDTQRKKISLRFSKPHTETHKINQGISKKNKVVAKDKNGNVFQIDKNDPRWISGELVGLTKGNKASNITKQKLSEKSKNCKWYNNGTIETFLSSCPEGFQLGRLKKLNWNSWAKGKKLPENIRLKKIKFPLPDNFLQLSGKCTLTEIKQLYNVSYKVVYRWLKDCPEFKLI